MTPSEVLARAHEASRRMAAIDDEVVLLLERIGVQGHGYEHHGKSSVLDPMRHVDEALDGTAELEMERVECMRDVAAAWSVISGVEARVLELHDESEERRMAGDARAAEDTWAEADMMEVGLGMITSWSIYGRSVAEVSSSTGLPAKACDDVMRAVMRWCDGQGIARLRSRVGCE